MTTTVRVPTPLRPLTQGRDEIAAQGKTVAEVLADLESQCPGISERLFDENGQVRRFVNIFVNGEEIDHLDGLDSAVANGDVLSIVPAIAGGRRPLCGAGALHLEREESP